jgi:hypothetical protein
MPEVFNQEHCEAMAIVYGQAKHSTTTHDLTSLLQLKSMLAPLVLRRLK